MGCGVNFATPIRPRLRKIPESKGLPKDWRIDDGKRDSKEHDAFLGDLYSGDSWDFHGFNIIKVMIFMMTHGISWDFMGFHGDFIGSILNMAAVACQENVKKTHFNRVKLQASY